MNLYKLRGVNSGIIVVREKMMEKDGAMRLYFQLSLYKSLMAQ